MIVALAERITGYLVSKNIITEEEYDVYKYGYEILTSSLLGVFIIIVSSIILDCMDIAVFFLCVFCGVRTFCMKTPLYIVKMSLIGELYV